MMSKRKKKLRSSKETMKRITKPISRKRRRTIMGSTNLLMEISTCYYLLPMPIKNSLTKIKTWWMSRKMLINNHLETTLMNLSKLFRRSLLKLSLRSSLSSLRAAKSLQEAVSISSKYKVLVLYLKLLKNWVLLLWAVNILAAFSNLIPNKVLPLKSFLKYSPVRRASNLLQLAKNLRSCTRKKSKRSQNLHAPMLMR